MRLIGWLLAVVLLAGVIFVGGAFLLPSTTVIERSRSMALPPADAFALLDAFERFEEWSPWAGFDPQARYVRSGPARGVGARLAWSGNRALGSGSQEIVAHDRSAGTIDLMLEFNGYPARTRYRIVPADGGSTVSWRLEMPHGGDPLARWIGLLMERSLGPDLERGLANIERLDAAPAGD